MFHSVTQLAYCIRKCTSQSNELRLWCNKFGSKKVQDKQNFTVCRHFCGNYSSRRQHKLLKGLCERKSLYPPMHGRSKDRNLLIKQKTDLFQWREKGVHRQEILNKQKANEERHSSIACKMRMSTSRLYTSHIFTRSFLMSIS